MVKDNVYYGMYNKGVITVNDKYLFVFGDNLKRDGYGGQSCIRDCYNAVGVATKILPNEKPEAYFSDDPKWIRAVIQELDNAVDVAKAMNKELVFPASGLGNGLADMNNKAPRLYYLMNARISTIIGYDYSQIVNEFNKERT